MPDKLKKILVADDDDGIVDAVTMMLIDAGYDVTSTFNAKEVLNLKTDLPDLLLLDIWMSGIDGSDVCRELKNKKETQNMPIILVSANKDTESIAKKCGADDFIAKPFEMETFLLKVKACIDKVNTPPQD